MQPYEFISGSASLEEQPDGTWIATFEATVYTGQSYTELSNSIDPNGVRVIEFEVDGPETTPLVNLPDSSAPYHRGAETEVELVLSKGGKRKDGIRTYYP